MVQTVEAQPEFCPNSACRFHDRGAAATHQWFIRFGRFHTRARGFIQRFRCTECGKTCSTQTFSVHYWTHYTNDLAWLLGQLSTCAGLRQIGRVAGVTHRVITNRCRRLARNALAVMDLALSTLTTDEHNYVDRQLRTCLAEYVRETTRHGREVNAQMERFSIFMVIHNFLTPHRITGHAQVLGQPTHAEVAGVTDKRVTALLKRMTTHRHVYTHLKTAQWWIRRIWLRLHENPPVVRHRRGTLVWRWNCLGQAALPRYLLV